MDISFAFAGNRRIIGGKWSGIETLFRDAIGKLHRSLLAGRHYAISNYKTHGPISLTAEGHKPSAVKRRANVGLT